MRCIYPAALAATSLLLFTSGCQHLPPRPLDLAETRATLQARELDLEPIQAYAAALASTAHDEAAPFDLNDGLSLREAQAVALWYNADLRIARLEAAQAGAVAQAAGRWSDPDLGLEGGEKAVDSDEAGFLRDAGNTTRSWINAGSLSITIPLSGRLRAEKRLHATAHEAALLRAAEAEWQLLGTVREAWAEWSATKARVDLLKQHLDLLGQFADTANALATAGELGSSSARLFAIERIRKEAERDREVAAETERRIGLLRLLGLPPDAPVLLLPSLPIDALAPEARPVLEAHPTILRLRAEYQIAEDVLRVQLRKQYPDLTLSPTYSNEQDESALVLGLGFPIPVWNANRQGIAEAAAARDTTRARVEAAYENLIGETAQAQAALAGAHAQRTRLVDEVVPIIDAQISEALALLQVGEIDIMLLYEALTQALETKQEILSAALAEARAAARVSAATAFDTVARDANSEKK